MAALATIPSKPETENGEYYGAKAAAKKLNVGERWLRDGANHHGFPHSRPGGFLIFSAADLAEIYNRFRTPGFTAVRRPAARRRSA